MSWLQPLLEKQWTALMTSYLLNVECKSNAMQNWHVYHACLFIKNNKKRKKKNKYISFFILKYKSACYVLKGITVLHEMCLRGKKTKTKEKKKKVLHLRKINFIIYWMHYGHATVGVGCGCIRGMEMIPHIVLYISLGVQKKCPYQKKKNTGIWKSSPSPGTHMWYTSDLQYTRSTGGFFLVKSLKKKTLHFGFIERWTRALYKCTILNATTGFNR